MQAVPDPLSYLAVAGHLVLTGKEPDGDSVRFVPDDASLLPRLEHGDRLRVSRDGSVQLRFDAVDAAELHYQGLAQPYGAVARDSLLAQLGFTDVTYAPNGTTVTSATPESLPAVVLTRLVEVNGRPVGFVLTGEAATPLAGSSGQRATLTGEMVRQTANYWLLASGHAYLLVYASTDPRVRASLHTPAAQARGAGLGVWPLDRTAEFPLVDQASLGPDGVLILPKLFRRATDYLRDAGVGTLPDWLIAHADTEDDSVIVANSDPVPLHTLIEQSGDRAKFSADPLDLVFVER